MSSIKISQLPQLPSIAANTSNTLFLGVDLPTGITGKFTATLLAQQLYANNALTVGNNIILFSNTVGQLSGYDPSFLQTNMQNFNANGSGDFVITGDKGTNSNNYIDLGLSGSNFQTNPTVGTAFLPNDGYLYVQGPDSEGYVGNLLIGTATANAKIMFAAGGLNVENIVGHIDKTGLHFDNIDQDIAANLVAGMSYTNTKIAVVNSNNANTTSLAQGAFNTANVANTTVTNLAGVVNILQSQLSSNANSIVALTDFTQSAYNTVNTLVISSNTANLATQTQAAFNKANTNANAITSLIVINGVQNNSINAVTTIATAANNKANQALANTSGLFNGDLSVSGMIKFGNSSIQYMNTASPATMLISSDTNIAVQVGSQSVNFSDGGTTIPNHLDVQSTTMIANSTYDYANSALVRIIGSSGAMFQPPANPGYMLSITGVDGISSRVINSSYGTGAYALFAGRKGNGTAGTPTAVANNDILARVSASGHNGNSFTQFGQTRIDFVAAEDFTVANTGTHIEFWNTIPGSNTLTKIAKFNALSVDFSGYVKPQKGFIYTPTQYPNSQTAITLDFANDTVIRCSTSAGLTITPTNFTSGKVVKVWITNTTGTNQTLTHGCSSVNSTVNSTTYAIPGTSTICCEYMSFDGDLANTFVSIIHP